MNDELCKIRPSATPRRLNHADHGTKRFARGKDGKSPSISQLRNQHSTQVSLLERLLNSAFAGSKTALVMRLFGDNSVSKDEVQELKEFLDKLDSEATRNSSTSKGGNVRNDEHLPLDL